MQNAFDDGFNTEIERMEINMTNSAVMNRKAYTKNVSEQNMTLIQRFKKYLKENGPMINAGMLAMNGDTSAWKMYMEDQNR